MDERVSEIMSASIDELVELERKYMYQLNEIKSLLTLIRRMRTDK